MKHLICNLKANKTLNEIISFEHELRKIEKSSTQLIICPSAPYMICFPNDNYILGSQDVSCYEEGSYTGEITAKQLASVGVKYTLIGHCERRIYNQETEKQIISKIKNALKEGIQILYIIGETEEDKNNDEIFTSLETQIARVMNEFNREDLKNFSIVYEPEWAVDNKGVINKHYIENNIKFIKKIINEYYELELDVIYGGSINEENVKEIKDIKILDGIMIGRNSQDPEKIHNIYEQIKN